MIHCIKNLKIRLKLYILIGVALLGMLIISGMSFFLMGRMNDVTSDIATSWLPSVDAARELSTTISNVRLNELEYITAGSDSEEETSLRFLQNEIERMDALLAAYGDMIDEEERNFYNNASNLWTQYQAAEEEMMAFAEQGRPESARAILDGECAALFSSLNSAFDDIIAYNTKGSDDAAAESASLYRTAILTMAAVVIAIILVGVFFSFVIIRLIKIPISEIQNAAIKMAEGDLNVKISYTSKDELGVLAVQVGRLIHKLQLIIEDENQFLAKMAEGDFTVDSACEEVYTGGFYPLLVSFRGIADKLNDTMLQISQSSAQVAGGADQVSNGSQALAQGATEQASSVQELAATIDVISNKVNQNADSARQASKAADAVSVKMNVSKEKMQQMTHAMGDISSCSSEISKIMKIIEDIAFQTNILALNAAVEAARAGAAGKGFAVVADEVRNLANKSTEASENIAALIANSLQAIENGTQIADDTAQSLIQAVSDVNEMAGIIEQISEASSDQADSIAQLTVGIDQISNVVQTNSATAEESAAASEELSSQSQLMKNLVERFQLKSAPSKCSR
ncbi:HAMP domain-containing protein [Colidextribacter sp. OB.20]|uniref:methyl-accepting chemotaxis protein n=1 Tax=Colidextribacter sp. OB.20 TaxID=2304568 RepID=UPI0013707D9F|nr:methyl-accepting chemotaxis protein [Colidextribacter sp. OB.20]NBI10422.1 HAMP domain-containing protein [Colidextribacter sp. OB.20]